MAGGVLVVLALVTAGLVRANLDGHRDAGAQVSYNAATHVVGFQLPAFRDCAVSSSQFAGRPLVVNFYASWCEVCDSEMPQFEAVYQQLKPVVAFVGVNPQQGGSDTDALQAAMVARTGVTYATARDAQNALLSKFNTSGALPTTLFIDATGRVVDVYNGGLTQAALRARLARDFNVRA